MRAKSWLREGWWQTDDRAGWSAGNQTEIPSSSHGHIRGRCREAIISSWSQAKIPNKISQQSTEKIVMLLSLFADKVAHCGNRHSARGRQLQSRRRSQK